MKVGISVVHYGDDSQFMCKNDIEASNKDVFLSIMRDNNLDNVGFSIGNNEIILKFLHGGSDPSSKPEWIWLLNNDTQAPKETFNAIEKILPELDSNIGIVGFQIRSMDDHDFIHHAGTYECLPAGIHKSGSVRLKQFNQRTSEKWVTFASVLIRREVFEQIGLLDEKMFNYFSDSDFCYRARYAGFKIIYEPSFIIYHKIGSSQNPKPEQMRIIQQDGMIFQNKWINGYTFFSLDKELL